MAEVVNGWMKAGIKDTEIERRLEQAGHRYSRITLGKHRRAHLTAPHERKRQEAVAAMQKQQRTIKGPSKVDLAALVVDTVVAGVEEGRLEPSISDGLRALGVIEQRAERGANHDFLLGLAQALGGAVRARVTEGEFREIDAEAAEDEEHMVKLLGAGE